MTIDEINEDLKAQFGAPRNQTEENIRYVLSLVAEHVEGDHVNENVPKPSLDALATTITAVMTYGTTPWEELCKKPAIKRTLTYVAIRSKDHYDEIEDLVHQLMKKHYTGLSLKMINGFMKIINALAEQSHPTKFLEYVTYPQHYDEISQGLHKLIYPEKGEDTAIIISCAIEDGLIQANIPRSVIIKEFEQTKSGFNRYFTMYHEDAALLDPSKTKWLNTRKAHFKTSIRATIGYTVNRDGTIKFFKKALKFRNILTLFIAWIRSFFKD